MAEKGVGVVEGEDVFSDLYLTGVEFAGERERRELGRGSYGVVYEVMWRGTPCAAKKIHPLLLESVPGGANSVIRGFIKECSTWSKLRHPHVAQFLGLYRTPEDQLPLLITEKMESSLSQLLKTYPKESFPLPHKVSILRQVALGLAYLHGTTPPTAHRDLSANNILINITSITAKITDFGVAKLMDPAGTHSHTMVPGTQAYMAPEAELGPSCDYTEKVDIFSFGVLIIHTLTHQLPVPGPTRAKVNGRMIAVGEYERRKHYLRVCSDAEVEAFQKPIQRCLEFDQDDRITSISLVQDLQMIQEVVGVPTLGNFLQDTPQSKDGDELKEVQEKLLAAELKARKTEELRKEEVETLERKIQILQQKNEEAPADHGKCYNIDADQCWSSDEILTSCGSPRMDQAMQADAKATFISNAVHINEHTYVNRSLPYGKQRNSLYKITRVPEGKPKLEELPFVLPWPVERYGLASFKDSLLVVGGKFTSANKPAGSGSYSSRVFTYSPLTKKIEVTFPPMRSACASPAVVTHEGLIIVVHGEGADSGVEVLDTTITNPDWKRAEPLPYFSATPSATIVNGYLVVWIGTVYCMHLSCITSSKQTSHHFPSSWSALPSPPTSSSLKLANYKDHLAAFAIGQNHKVYSYVFHHASMQWIKLQELGDECSESKYSHNMISASVTAQLVTVIWQCYQEGTDGRYNSMQLNIQTGVIPKMGQRITVKKHNDRFTQK